MPTPGKRIEFAPRTLEDAIETPSISSRSRDRPGHNDPFRDRDGHRPGDTATTTRTVHHNALAVTEFHGWQQLRCICGSDRYLERPHARRHSDAFADLHLLPCRPDTAGSHACANTHAFANTRHSGERAGIRPRSDRRQAIRLSRRPVAGRVEVEPESNERNHWRLRHTPGPAGDEDGRNRVKLADQPYDPGQVGAAVRRRSLRHSLPGLEFPHRPRVVLRNARIWRRSAPRALSGPPTALARVGELGHSPWHSDPRPPR